MAIKQDLLFYIARTAQEVAGPYDLAQMAGLLRRRIITPETNVFSIGQSYWAGSDDPGVGAPITGSGSHTVNYLEGHATQTTP
jgi:hypothetical protein